MKDKVPFCSKSARRHFFEIFKIMGRRPIPCKPFERRLATSCSENFNLIDRTTAPDIIKGGCFLYLYHYFFLITIVTSPKEKDNTTATPSTSMSLSAVCGVMLSSTFTVLDWFTANKPF